VDAASTEQVHVGAHSIKATGQPGQNLQIGVCPIDAGRFNALDFWLYTPTGNVGLVLRASIMDTTQPDFSLSAPTAGAWTHYSVPLSTLGVAGAEYVKSFSFALTNPGATTYYVDDVKLVGNHQ
jgi:hypothetical protein